MTEIDLSNRVSRNYVQKKNRSANLRSFMRRRRREAEVGGVEGGCSREEIRLFPGIDRLAAGEGTTAVEEFEENLLVGREQVALQVFVELNLVGHEAKSFLGLGVVLPFLAEEGRQQQRRQSADQSGIRAKAVVEGAVEQVGAGVCLVEGPHAQTFGGAHDLLRVGLTAKRIHLLEREDDPTVSVPDHLHEGDLPGRPGQVVAEQDRAVQEVQRRNQTHHHRAPFCGTASIVPPQRKNRIIDMYAVKMIRLTFAFSE